jgi:NAD(P)-dependent dehydrogenase (short-subunit alcohol dehydrogenase family)
MIVRIQDKVAIVTGSGGPMGFGIAERFAEEGAILVLNDISGRRLEASRKVLAERGHPVTSLRADVCTRTEAEALVQLALTNYGRVDILINTVGGMKGPLFVPVMELDDERWDFTMRLNLKGLLYCTQLVAPGMRERGSGKIVNIASISFAGEPDQADYAAAKAGVASFTRSCALTFAPEITVNCIVPGLIETSVTQRGDTEKLEALRAITPLKKLGKPRDIANAALFLASDEADHITGQLLTVSGGIWPAL